MGHSKFVSCRKLHSVILAFLIFAVGARGGDEDAGGTAIFSEPQVREQQSKELLLKSEVSPGQQPKLKHTNIKGYKASELQGSTSVVQAMREEMKSAKRLATFARLNKRPRLFRELQSRIKEIEQAVGATVVDADLPKSTPEKMRALRRVLSRATERHNKCEDTVKRLQSLVVLNENKVLGLKEENKFLSRLAARTMPKGLHCLALQLTIEYYHQRREGSVIADEKKLTDSGLFHYVMYTENILAATAIVNSTLHFAKEPHRHIFHVLTDGLNHAAMQMWFWINTPYKGVVEVKNLESLSGLHVSWGLHEQARKHLKAVMSRAHLKQEENLETIKRIRLYYNLPEVFCKLDKLMVLDDNIVVRKDLTHLWEEDLHNKVIGAVRSSSKDEAMLDWSCINVVDLGEWRRQGLDKQSILTLEEEMGEEVTSFHNNVHMLHDSAYYVVDLDDTCSELDNDTQNAAAIHYRGYAKPWLGMGMSRHGSLWTSCGSGSGSGSGSGTPPTLHCIAVEQHERIAQTTVDAAPFLWNIHPTHVHDMEHV